jgi:hypothetical protein
LSVAAAAANFVARLRRASRRPPGYLARRALDSARRRARRPWARVYPRLLTDRTLLQTLGVHDIDEAWRLLQARPFFLHPSDQSLMIRRFSESYPAAEKEIRRTADAVLRHEFDLLGSGPVALGQSLPWTTDFKTGRCWPAQYCSDIEYHEYDRPTDVKVPWELSRCQHFARLGQAYWLTGNDQYAQEFAAEIADWEGANPYAWTVNWACAMDVALRAVSWIWGFYFMGEAPACRDSAFRAKFLRTLFLHGEFITAYLEKADLNGNHYLCDAAGLVFLGGLFGATRKGQRWMALGRRIVVEEIFKQVTDDGVDFEQSTAYHRLVLEAFSTSYLLLKMHGQVIPDAAWKRLELMHDYVEAYIKPNGQAPLVGDADDGRIQMLGRQGINDHRYLLSTGAVLFERADFKARAADFWEESFWLLGASGLDRYRRLPEVDAKNDSRAFSNSGVFVLRSDAVHMIVDCGEVGFGGRGGHGHNDILSFELFLNGFNVVTDCGAYLYTASPEWRNRFRSTEFHNTVQIDGEELNRFVGPHALWQLHYDAVPSEAALVRRPCVDEFRGGHRGYERLRSPVRHARRIWLDRRSPRVLVNDRLEGSDEHVLQWRFHLDPSVVADVEGRDVRLRSGEKTVWLLPDEAAVAFTLSLQDGWVSPSYGVKVPTRVVVWETTATLPVSPSFLFSESRLSESDRRRASDELTQGQGPHATDSSE